MFNHSKDSIMKIHAGILPASTVRVAVDVLIPLQSSSLISKLSMLLFANHQAMLIYSHRFI
jgi:hypothetical protein